MAKQDIYNKHLENRYAGIELIISDDKYNEEDVKSFLRFQDSKKIHKGYQNWLTYMGIADKIRRKGISSVLTRSDVDGISKGAEDDGRGNIIIYNIVKTKYGEIYVNGDKNVIYIR